jgi:hypothetical protein
MSQVTDKFYHIMLYTSPSAGFELTSLVVIIRDLCWNQTLHARVILVDIQANNSKLRHVKVTKYIPLQLST